MEEAFFSSPLYQISEAADFIFADFENLLRSGCNSQGKIAGCIPEALCIQFLTRYENERQEKLAERTELTAQLDARQEDEKSVDDWIALIRDFTYLDTLDCPTLLRLINRIDISERREENGQQVRDIKIHYNFVGYIQE